MENPATWNAVHYAIAEAQDKWREDNEKGICGLSEVAAIYNALVDKGFIKEDVKINVTPSGKPPRRVKDFRDK